MKMYRETLFGPITVAGIGRGVGWGPDSSIDTPVDDSVLTIRHQSDDTHVDETPRDAAVDVQYLNKEGKPINPGTQGVGERPSAIPLVLSRARARDCRQNITPPSAPLPARCLAGTNGGCLHPAMEH